MAQPKGVHLETSMVYLANSHKLCGLIYDGGVSKGEVAVELYWKHAPKTCRNFAELVLRPKLCVLQFHFSYIPPTGSERVLQ